jgi:hypothetical protein
MRPHDSEKVAMRSAVLVGSLAIICLVIASPSRADLADGRRPLFHFTPTKNFINDPNGRNEPLDHGDRSGRRAKSASLGLERSELAQFR